MIDEGLLRRVRAAITAHTDTASLLASYAEPRGRALLRERVRAACAEVDDATLEQLCADLFGFGPLQPLLDDPDVTDVLVCGPERIFVERRGRLERVDVSFARAADLADLVYRIAASVGRELTIEQPFVDARMRDGSRANAVIEPVGGPTLCIRTFRQRSIPLAGPSPSWIADGDLTTEGAELLREAVRAHRNIVVSGATGTGKSTLLRTLASLVPASERLVVIEDTNELVLPHPHAVHLECAPGRDGGGVRVADLVANALRMRPDRIVVGEVRTPREASALLEALSTGHDGSFTTLHAGSADDAISRLELLLARAGELAPVAIRDHVLRAIDLVVQLGRAADGRRVIREIAQVRDAACVIVWRSSS